MLSQNAVVILIIMAIVLLAVFYIVKAKKRGQKCIGCPNSKQCGGNCSNNDKWK